MEMIYKMNETFMGATVTHSTPITPVSTLHAGNFNIAQYSNIRYMESREGTPGYYKSTMPNLAAYLTILKRIKSETDNPNLQTGNIYLGEPTVQLMIWGVVYDFMSFCTNLYGEIFEESEMSIADSRIQLTTDIAEYRTEDFYFGNLKNVFMSIARCANGILTNAFISKMINDHEVDSEDENDLNNNNISDHDRDEDKLEPPVQKRQCNRMSILNQSK